MGRSPEVERRHADGVGPLKGMARAMNEASILFDGFHVSHSGVDETVLVLYEAFMKQNFQKNRRA